MSVAPRDLLANAKSIHGSCTDEAGLRAAISRSYYAAYHAAYAFHDSLPTPGSNAGSKGGKHETLCTQLSQPTFSTANPRFLKSKRVGIFLRDAMRARVLADYYIGAMVNAPDADAAVLKCTSLVEMCTGA